MPPLLLAGREAVPPAGPVAVRGVRPVPAPHHRAHLQTVHDPRVRAAHPVGGGIATGPGLTPISIHSVGWEHLSDDELVARLAQRNPGSTWNWSALVADRDHPDGQRIITDYLAGRGS